MNLDIDTHWRAHAEPIGSLNSLLPDCRIQTEKLAIHPYVLL